MTALSDEVEGAIAEGAEILELHAAGTDPQMKMESDSLVASKKMAGLIKGGRLLRQLPERERLPYHVM